MAWKYLLLGAATYVLGALSFIRGVGYGTDLVEARGHVFPPGEIAPVDWAGLFMIGTLGAIPGIIITPTFFAVYWLFRRRLPMPELLAMLVALSLSFLLGVGWALYVSS